MAALNSAFSSSSSTKATSVSRPVGVGQGSQRAAAVAALSSVLTAEKKQPTETEVAESVEETNWAESEPKPEQEQDDSSDCSQTIFSYDRLKAKSDNPVTGIDFKRREAYLSDEEFTTVFGTTKEAFYKLPKWKQDMLKRKVDLF
nr:villin-3-like isoform X2 [Ipomoea batatas]